MRYPLTLAAVVVALFAGAAFGSIIDRDAASAAPGGSTSLKPVVAELKDLNRAIGQTYQPETVLGQLNDTQQRMLTVTQNLETIDRSIGTTNDRIGVSSFTTGSVRGLLSDICDGVDGVGC